MFAPAWTVSSTKEAMKKNSRSLVLFFIALVFFTSSTGAEAQRQPSPIDDRQVAIILQRLELHSTRFRGTINLALIERRVDQTRRQNDINTFEPGLRIAINQFKEQIRHGRASVIDVLAVLERASLINGFMTRNRLNPQAQSDWASVRTDLNALSNAYGLKWQWNVKTAPEVIASRLSRQSEREVDLLIQRIENRADTFRSSLTDAFGESRYDHTLGERNMNDAVRNFKNATNQLRNLFDTGQPLATQVERVLAWAIPIDAYMLKNLLTERVQKDWSTLRIDLNALSRGYDLSAN